MGQRIEEIERPKAVEAQREGTKKGGVRSGESRRGETNSGINNPKVHRDESRRTTAKAAAAVGMSRSTYEKTGNSVNCSE